MSRITIEQETQIVQRPTAKSALVQDFAYPVSPTDKFGTIM